MKREQFLSWLRRYCRKHDLAMVVDEKRGKGSHITVIVAGRQTILKSGELMLHYVAGVLKQLGLEPDDLD